VDAVVRNLEIIGEASKGIPDEKKCLKPEVDWAAIKGLRNRIVHDYTGVDLAIVWEVARNALPGLQTQIEALVE
jgi:uncharacterized protein with HEPN domain